MGRRHTLTLPFNGTPQGGLGETHPPMKPDTRGDPLDDAIIEWADASARLAAALRGASPQPRLCIVRAQRARYSPALLAALVATYWLWAHSYRCACTWHLAFEVHPLFQAVHWMTAVSASVIWQLFDRAKRAPVPSARLHP